MIQGRGGSMYSSVFLDTYKSDIHYWEYENGVKVHKIAPPPFYFFVECDEEHSDGYKTIFGKPARKIEEDKWWKYKQKRDRYHEWGMKLYESDVPIETKFIIDNYMGQELVVPNFDIHYLDIEVHSERGFPRPEDAQFPITIITVWSTKHNKFFVFAEKDFDESFITSQGEDVEKFIFKDEGDLLTEYMLWTREEHPDIMTGWNSNGYDIPYIMNRAKILFGEEAPSRISPIDKAYERRVPVGKYKFELRWTIAGISTLDMLEIYKEYTFSEQESWKLNYIGKVEEVGQKVEYDGSLADLYKDWQKYVEYNVQDVRILRKLEEKKKFISLLITFCYGCRVPFEQYQKTTRVLDGAFISSLSSERIVLPDVIRPDDDLSMSTDDDNDDEEDSQYVGGYVKTPIAGMHDWVLSFDATSLYPSIMMGWNISPETKIGVIPQEYVKNIMLVMINHKRSDPEQEVRVFGETVTTKELVEFIKENNYAMACNGVLYRQDIRGIFPKFIEEWFNKRKEYKKKMLAADAQGNLEDKEKYHNLQLNYKILINSVYGYLGTKFSRFFDEDSAVAVTMTGRYITMTTGASIETHFNSKNWTKNEKYSKYTIELEDNNVITL
jgi:DNA polymerase elongation subunit (family B)